MVKRDCTPEAARSCSSSPQIACLVLGSKLYNEQLANVQEAEADNKMKCEAICAVGRLVAFQSLTNDDWLGPQLMSHMVGHGKQVCCLWHMLLH